MAKQASDLAETKNAEYAWRQAEKIISSSTDEIMQISSYIRTRLVVIDEGVKNIDARFNALHDVLHDFHSGLTKTEATTIYDLFVLELKDGETGMEKLMNLTSGKAA